jgi:predicted adenine nucleotide alpha hydrolase (AANH) superfamily ATPase
MYIKGKLNYSTTPWDMEDLQDVVQDEITFSPKKQTKKVSQPVQKIQKDRKPKYHVPDFGSDEEEDEVPQVFPQRLRKIPV